MDITGYFQELDQMYNDEDFGRDETEQHDPDTEMVPILQQYMPAFAQAECKAYDTVQRVSQHVADEPDQDSESLYMHERVTAIERPAYPPPLRIAISGSSGIGKSTMINAILAVPTLCPTVNRPLLLSHNLVTLTLGIERHRCWHARAHGACPLSK